MGARSLVPLVDLVFLALGSVLAAMTQMERVEAIPVAVARVGSGAAHVRRGEFDVVSLTPDGLSLNGQPVDQAHLPARVAARDVVLRADQSLPTQRTLSVLAALVRAGADVSLQVAQDGPESSGEGSE